ncbi:hypothetical protein RA11412_0203 [Rothia aeria]|uniref:Uncharacterized protein n=1 Tax=Rothia aeria TaxID=172042 RepID=A0A2Z5QVU6_9MICC|nr:hypothetical protein RA11412_0203 [Rothia aeria]
MRKDTGPCGPNRHHHCPAVVTNMHKPFGDARQLFKFNVYGAVTHDFLLRVSCF